MVTTVPPHKYNDIIFGDTLTMLPSNVAELTKVKYDKESFSRLYNQGIGRGQTHEECRANLPVGSHITAQNPVPAFAQKELIEAVHCMAQFKDITKCKAQSDEVFAKANELVGFVKKEEFELEKVTLGIGAAAGDSTKLERFMDAVFNPSKIEDPTKIAFFDKIKAKVMTPYAPAALIALKFIKIR
eukprot:GEMP01063873.1.p1 GENE.GEMP01063873.1~~GEMP01063873.1.p1  ORF type:complete len:186 (+),score=44.76 GEMP01063873.1:87-644(+)